MIKPIFSNYVLKFSQENSNFYNMIFESIFQVHSYVSSVVKKKKDLHIYA